MLEAEAAYGHLTRPFACVDLVALDRNIAFVNKEAKGKGIRIATKSVRSTGLLHYIAERLDNHSGFMTFDLGETFYLLDQGLDDLLLGYPQMEESLIEKLIPFIKEGRTVVFMVDCLKQLAFLETIGKKNNVVLDVCIDINLSTDFKVVYFGTKRSSLHTAADVENLLIAIASFTHTKMTGVMGYEAQIAGVTDRPTAKWQTPMVKILKRLAEKRIRTLRQEVVEIIRNQYPTIRFVNGGGSGSIDFTAKQQEVTEITIGSAFYYPALFSGYDNLPLDDAVTFALRVTRKPEEGIVVCHGGGYIASGATSTDKNPVPVWPKNLSYIKNEGAGEVQTPLRDQEQALEIGDTVYFKHAKAGELCERFTELHARRGTEYAGAFRTYRGEGECFL